MLQYKIEVRSCPSAALMGSYPFHSNASLLGAVGRASELVSEHPHFYTTIECPDGEVFGFFKDSVPSTSEVKEALFEHYAKGDFEYLVCEYDSWVYRLRCPEETGNAIRDLFNTIKHYRNELSDANDYALYRGNNKLAERMWEVRKAAVQKALQKQLADVLQIVDVSSGSDSKLMCIAPYVAIKWFLIVCHKYYVGPQDKPLTNSIGSDNLAACAMQTLCAKMTNMQPVEETNEWLIQQTFTTDEAAKLLEKTIQHDDTNCYSLLSVFMQRMKKIFTDQENV